ncbi:hypothetical protein [Bacillus infantis]|uniref:hypothetical protein n=1 Tax=Bacillus infantis TaxID=324767 RepID=UPI0032195A48
MKNMFILKTDDDSCSFKKKLDKFLADHCKNTETNAAVYEVNECIKEKVQKELNIQ